MRMASAMMLGGMELAWEGRAPAGLAKREELFTGYKFWGCWDCRNEVGLWFFPTYEHGSHFSVVRPGHGRIQLHLLLSRKCTCLPRIGCFLILLLVLIATLSAKLILVVVKSPIGTYHVALHWSSPSLFTEVETKTFGLVGTRLNSMSSSFWV